MQVARNTKIINADTDEPKYVINIKQIAKYVVALGEKVSPTDIEEGMRVGVDRNKYQIQVPLCFCAGATSPAPQLTVGTAPLPHHARTHRFRCHRESTPP